MRDKIRHYLNNDFMADMLVSLWGAFMLCLFAPLEIYLSNKDYFFFDGTEIAPYAVIFTVIVSAIMVFTMLLCSVASNRLHSIIRGAMAGLFLATYIQGNYWPASYGILDGTEIDWSNFRGYGVISVIMFMTLVILAVILHFKGTNELVDKVLMVVSICIILVQVVTLLVLMIEKEGLNKPDRYIATDENLGDYSNDENIVVFVLDSYDSIMLQRILDEDTDGYYHALLEDFTYYPDTSGRYSYTALAVPQIITGLDYYNDRTYGDYLTEAYTESALLGKLKLDKWNTEIYSEVSFPDNDIALEVNNCRLIHMTVSSHKRLMEYMYKFVGFRYAPQFLKQYFWFYPDDMYPEIGANNQDISQYGDSNIKFANSIKSIEADNQKKTFKIIHLYGAHPPYTINEGCTKFDDNTDEITVSRAMLVMIGNYTNKLKEIGAYDNTSIVICADHGTINRQNPIFCVKMKNENHSLEISDKTFSYIDLQNLMVDLTNDNSLSAVEQDNMNRKNERTFLSYSHDRSLAYDSYCSPIEEYKIIGNASDANAISTGITYIERDD